MTISGTQFFFSIPRVTSLEDKVKIHNKEELMLHTVFIKIFNLRTAAFKAYCAIWVRRSKFRHQASQRVSPRESTQRRKIKLWARNVRKFCLNADLNVTFRYLLHAIKATTWNRRLYFPSEGRRAEDFFRPKNPTASAGFEPANLGTKGQHATSRPPKPLTCSIFYNII